MKLSIVLLGALLALAHAGCPDSCSGHGTCGAAEKCTCEAGYMGLNCAKRECPYGLSWTSASDDDAVVPGGRGLGGTHPYTECSSAGDCDYSSGTCACYPGYSGRGCRRKACPNDCSGHGKCYSNFEVDKNYTSIGGASFNTLFRDFLSSRQCVCDRGFKGADCSERICPKGDDPVTDCGTSTDGAAHEMIQRIYVRTLASGDATSSTEQLAASTADCAAQCGVTDSSCAGYFECDASKHSYCSEKTRWYANEAMCQRAYSNGMFDTEFTAEAIDCSSAQTSGFDGGVTPCPACNGETGICRVAGGSGATASNRGVCNGKATGASCVQGGPTSLKYGKCKADFVSAADPGSTADHTAVGKTTIFGGYIALKYTDMFGGVYKTRPILISNQCNEAQFIAEYNSGVFGGAHDFNYPTDLNRRALQYGGLGTPKLLQGEDTSVPADGVGDSLTPGSTNFASVAAGSTARIQTDGTAESTAAYWADAEGREDGNTGSILTRVHQGTMAKDEPVYAAAPTSGDDTGILPAESYKYDQLRSSRYLYTADRIRSALQDLPNFAVPTVNVTNYYIDRKGTGTNTKSIEKVMFTNVFDVTFTSEFTSGRQPLMECIYEQSNACEGAFPRLANSGSHYDIKTSGQTAVGNDAYLTCNPARGFSNLASSCNEKYFPNWGSVNVQSCTVEEVHPGTKTYEENVECSNRGICDTSSGTCTCFEGHTGEACQTQTVFF